MVRGGWSTHSTHIAELQGWFVEIIIFPRVHSLQILIINFWHWPFFYSHRLEFPRSHFTTFLPNLQMLGVWGAEIITFSNMCTCSLRNVEVSHRPGHYTMYSEVPPWLRDSGQMDLQSSTLRCQLVRISHIVGALRRLKWETRSLTTRSYWYVHNSLNWLFSLLLKTDSGYPKDTGVTLSTLATPGNPLRYKTPWWAIPVSALAHSISSSVSFFLKWRIPNLIIGI